MKVTESLRVMEYTSYTILTIFPKVLGNKLKQAFRSTSKAEKIIQLDVLLTFTHWKLVANLRSIFRTFEMSLNDTVTAMQKQAFYCLLSSTSALAAKNEKLHLKSNAVRKEGPNHVAGTPCGNAGHVRKGQTPRAAEKAPHKQGSNKIFSPGVPLPAPLSTGCRSSAECREQAGLQAEGKAVLNPVRTEGHKRWLKLAN
ncbi:hypothetical protein Anapl_00421 [Anas platyrhynchos]|uniref:Uncharacterized protein n=1 Tax=Anas platyrhynchos TaxID=8839 RepID=R0L621_ANAPL|nr:hypothetical protein Anapl_00421 [Anas platyrhynchos]